MAPLPHSSQVLSTINSQPASRRGYWQRIFFFLFTSGSAVQSPVESTCTQTFEWLCCASRMSTRPRHILLKALTNGNRSHEARPAHASPAVNKKLLRKYLSPFSKQEKIELSRKDFSNNICVFRSAVISCLGRLRDQSPTFLFSFG